MSMETRAVLASVVPLIAWMTTCVVFYWQAMLGRRAAADVVLVGAIVTALLLCALGCSITTLRPRGRLFRRVLWVVVVPALRFTLFGPLPAAWLAWAFLICNCGQSGHADENDEFQSRRGLALSVVTLIAKLVLQLGGVALVGMGVVFWYRGDLGSAPSGLPPPRNWTVSACMFLPPALGLLLDLVWALRRRTATAGNGQPATAA